MPELPEVQTIVNDLQKITGDTITGFWTRFEKAIKTRDLSEIISGKKIISIKRLGKNIVIEIVGNLYLIIHLKMTGKLVVNDTVSAIDEQKHLHHIFYLKKNKFLEFHDIRKFATIEVVNKEKFNELANSKGVDPLSEDFSKEKLTKLIEKRKSKNIKAFLMDQTAISGIGNIYASEIPFDAKLDPHRKMLSLSGKEIATLYHSILKILSKAIELRGTSFSDYRDAFGKKGSFQNFLKVYKKSGKNCFRCGTIIQKSVVEQRSTFYCPSCQK